MKKYVKKIIDYIRMLPLFRLIFYPYIIMKTKSDIKIYAASEDSAYIYRHKQKFEGMRCFIVGNGPSLKVEDLDRLRTEYTFASNGIVHLFNKTEWRPNWYMVVDKIIINQMDRWDLSLLKGIKMLVYDKEFVDTHRDILDIHYFVRAGKYYIKPEKQVMNNVSEDVSRFFSRSQSISTSLIELAIFMGFTNIYLVGFDHAFPVEINKNGIRNTNGKNMHHFDGYQGKVRDVAYIDAITEAYQNIRKYADANNIKIWNATRGGNLDIFDRISFEEAIK